MGRALRSVALADVGSLDDHDSNRTVGEVLSERLELVVPWYRAFPGARRVDEWVQRINRALGADSELRASTNLASLGSLERAVVLVAAALTEKPGVVFVDLGDAPVPGADTVRLPVVLAALAPIQTTIALGARDTEPPMPALEGAAAGREYRVLALDAANNPSLDRDGATR